MRIGTLGAMDVSAMLFFGLAAAFSYSAWLTSIVFCARQEYPHCGSGINDGFFAHSEGR